MIPIARHRMLTSGLAIGFVFVLVSLVALLFVDPESLGSPVLASAWLPVMSLGFVFFSIAVSAILRSRGRVLVGGQGWLAPYHARFPRPLQEKAWVEDPDGLKLVVSELRPQFARGQFKSWIELVVVDKTGDEVVRCFANPAWLIDDYQERFEDWKDTQTITPA